MPRKPIHTEHAPAAIGPYEQAIQLDGLIFTSGQIALNPATGEFMAGEIEEETTHTLNHIKAILQAGGADMDDIVKTTVYLDDLGNFARMNAIYEQFFPNNKPARACVQVAALPKGAKVEIDAIATRKR